ncbi:hypothetical protein PWT90_06886 [Aphanocladium album]|nr:hypothetical protein PWT90_06886 [Aphanocladium album]
MTLHVLDPEGDIVITLQTPNKQNLGVKSTPLAPPKKKGKKKRNRTQPILFFDDPTPVDAVEVATDAIDLPLEDISSLFQLPVARAISPDAKSASASARGGRSTHREVQYRVSSKHLGSASSIFKAILSGFYPERCLKEKFVVQDGSECRVLYTSDWDAEVFLMLMNCIHQQHWKLPKKVDLVKLTQFAVLVDYYNCHESTALLGGNWIKELRNHLPTVHGQSSMMWIFVSWVFADADIFSGMTELAVKASKRRVEVPDLLFPAALIDDIENEKRKIMDKMAGAIAKHHAKLRRGERDCAAPEACSTMLLGALSKAVAAAANVFDSCSPEEARTAVLEFQTPSWTEAGSFSRAANPETKDCWVAGGHGTNDGRGRGSSRGDGGFRGSFRGSSRGDRGGRGDRAGFRGDRGRGRGTLSQTVEVYPNPNAQDPKVRKAEDALHPPSTRIALDLGSLSVGERLPLRPGYGTRGTKVELTANYVELLPPADVTLHRYSIQIAPEPSRRKYVRLVELLLQSEELAPMIDELATDFRSTLISKKKLPSDECTVEIQYRAEGEDEPPGSGTSHTVRVSYVSSLCTTDVINYITSISINDRFDYKGEWEQTLNIFLNHYAKATKSLVTIGSSKTFSLGQQTGRADLGSGLQALRGFFSSVRIATGRILVNLNVSHAAFYQEGPLVGVMHSFGVRSTVALEKFLKLVQVQTTHLPVKRNKAGDVLPRFKTIFGLPRKDDGHGMAHPPRVTRHGAGAHDVQFWLQRDAPSQRNISIKKVGIKKAKGKGQTDSSESGEYISVFDFFKKTYNRTLQHPELPLVNCGNRDHPMYLPAEVCAVGPGQPSRSKLDSSQTQQMIRYAVRKPWINAASIATDGIPTVGLDGNSNVLLNTFEFNITPGLIKVPGRILSCPQITYKSGNKGTKIAEPRSGGWNMVDIKFNAGVALSRWSYLMISLPGANDSFDQNSLGDVMQEFRQALVKMGINATPPMPGQRLLLQHTDDAALGSVLQKAAKALQLLIIILPVANTPLYKQIKSLADKTYGIHTVCCVGPKLAKAHGRDQYIANVALKLNIKLGGVNQIMGDRQLGIIDHDKTMVVGLDVTHPSPGSSSNAPSVSAMVASIDKFLGQWPATLRIQAARQEKVEDLGNMLKSRLQLWKSMGKHTSFPENILVYRDGVSEGQHEMVTVQELPQLRHACEQLYPASDTKKGLPRFTIIICGKRHKTRFYPTMQKDCDKSGNTKPGTVVDRGVTEARNWDFFLQAHAALQGTARPCHYYIVHDEIFRQLYYKAVPDPFQNIADVVEDLTHKLCYSFGRATKAVSLCTPAYYADIVCERARCYLADVFDTPSASAAASLAGTSVGHGGKVLGTSDVQIHERLRDTMFYI